MNVAANFVASAYQQSIQFKPTPDHQILRKTPKPKTTPKPIVYHTGRGGVIDIKV